MKKIIRDNQLLLKKLLLIIYDIIAVSVSGYLALLMRFELEPSQIPEQFLNPYRRYNWIMIIVTILVFYVFRLYSSLWTYVGEFNRGHMDGFKNIPVDELRERINEIEKGKPVYLICQSGLRSYIASRILEGNGYETYNFSGGFRFYDAVVNDRALIEKAYACGMDY